MVDTIEEQEVCPVCGGPVYESTRSVYEGDGYYDEWNYDVCENCGDDVEDCDCKHV